MIIDTPAKAPNTIPVIDLADAFTADFEKHRAIASAIHKACRETGFFTSRTTRSPGGRSRAIRLAAALYSICGSRCFGVRTPC
jgi:isopenicillin N synthase-like dioxygenase